MDWVETTFWVRYAETDAMGIVHHSRYIVWFEEGRSQYLRARGANYADFEAAGYWLTVTEVEARYLAPARYGRQVTVRAQLEALRSRSLSMLYEVRDTETGQTLVTGRTKHLCTNWQGQVVTIPAGWRRVLAASAVDEPAE